MNYRKKYFSIVAALWLTLPAVSRAETKWRDEQSGTHFMTLAGAKTWREAYRTCKDRGWDLFNFEYLAADEQQRFLTSENLRNLTWKRSHAGEPGERAEVRVWMSSESNSTLGGEGSSSSLLLTEIASESGKRRSRIEWGGKDGDPKQTVCFYQSHTWVGCSHEIDCAYEQVVGRPLHIRYSIYEWGPHRGVALSRIRDRARNWPGGIGARCELAIKDPLCLDYR